MENPKRQKNSRQVQRTNNNMYMTLKEIIREHALCYLPAKSLQRCNAVSKDWKLRISSPFFIHTQSVFASSLSGLFCQTSEGSITFVPLNPKAHGVPDAGLTFLPEPVDLVASSNGLLCCRGRTEKKAYYVCNPVNLQYKKLPEPQADHGESPALVLVFEPSVIKFDVEYKLICAFPSAEFEGAFEFEIYTSVDNSWKVSKEVCFSERPKRVLDRKGVHQNGIVYWLTKDQFFLAYDLNKNRATLIPCFGTWLGSTALGVVDGLPCHVRKHGSEILVSILANVHGIVTETSTSKSVWRTRRGWVASLGNGDGEKVLTISGDIVVFHDGYRIGFYNMTTRVTTTLGDKVVYEDDSFYVPYVNSLVQLQ